ncbi:uncharacterized protein [Penaeus vannamei]|uniref:uncharacterized protein n=1 Tax=Penaeus vannamei TaxID=6689 RepID=UPI00387FA376
MSGCGEVGPASPPPRENSHWECFVQVLVLHPASNAGRGSLWGGNHRDSDWEPELPVPSDDLLPLLSKEMERLRVEVAALSQVRLPGSGTISIGGYTYYWSSRSDGHHLQGVAITISSRLQPSVVGVTPFDQRIMICVTLASESDSCPRGDIRIVLGDFNAVSGCDRAGYEMSVRSHNSGTYASSKNNFPFRNFARSQKLRISGSWYQRSGKKYCWTWYSDAAKEFDHILISTRWRILQNYRVFRGCRVLCY